MGLDLVGVVEREIEKITAGRNEVHSESETPKPMGCQHLTLLMSPHAANIMELLGVSCRTGAECRIAHRIESTTLLLHALESFCKTSCTLVVLQC
jgi:selenocysteine lyase/cysteine desulfurase